jgi:putative oxidoreductase
MRFATGAVLIPHGIQKIMLGSATNLSVVIDKQMGVSFPLMWAYFAIFAESVGAICLAIGLFRRTFQSRSGMSAFGGKADMD